MRRTALFLTLALPAVFLPFAPAADPPVTVADDGSTYTLANGIVTAKVAKRSGDLVSLRFKDRELLSGGSGHPYGYWSHAATAPKMVKRFALPSSPAISIRAERFCNSWTRAICPQIS